MYARRFIAMSKGPLPDRKPAATGSWTVARKVKTYTKRFAAAADGLVFSVFDSACDPTSYPAKPWRPSCTRTPSTWF
jgi:hypothetical protein